MTRSKSKSSKVLIFILIFLGIVLFSAQWVAQYVVKDFLDRKIPPHLVLIYDDLDINVLSGTVGFDAVSLEIRNRNSLLSHTFLELERLELNEIGYGQLLFNKTIALNGVILQKPEFRYYPYNYFPSENGEPKGVVNLLKIISVEKLDIQAGSFYIMKDARDSIQVSIENYDFTFYGGKTGPELVTQKIPLEYDSYDLKASKIFADLGKYETITIGQLTTSEDELQINDVNLSSKYSKTDLSQQLAMERDYISLQIPRVKLNNLDFGFKENRFEIAATSLNFEEPKVELYRDKLVADDMRFKPLYGKLLRELPPKLSVDKLNIENGYFVYEEKINQEQEAGKLFFEGLNAELKGISNQKNAKNIEIAANAKLMGEADVKLDWSFDVNDETDSFSASGVLLNLQAARLNPFLEPNLQVRAKGSIEEMYFTVSGNSNTSQGDMKMKYRDFKFNILNEDRLKVNKVLTAIGNLFVNDGSKNDKNGYRYGKIEVERETNKSFYNYLWLNVRDGMINTLTGKGEEEK